MRTTKALVLPVLIYAAVLWNQPGLMMRWEVLFAILATFVLLRSQPDMRFSEARRDRASDRGSFYWILALGTLCQVVSLVDWCYWRSGEPRAWIWEGIGVTLVVIGLAIRIYAIRTLGNWFVSTVRIQSEQTVIQHGPFAWVRHPSYLGSLLTFLGITVLFGSWVGAGVAVGGLGAAYAIRIRAEETFLRANLGSGYVTYASRVPAFLPGVRVGMAQPTPGHVSRRGS